MIRVLDVRRGDVTYVTKLEPKLLLEAMPFVVDLHGDRSLLEIFAVRHILESHATGLAAQAARDADVATLRTEIDSVSAGTDLEELVAHDTGFHTVIAPLAGNDHLAGLLDSLTSQTLRARLWRGLTQAGATERTLAEHQAILDAIADHDVELTAALSAAHIAGIEKCCARRSSRDACRVLLRRWTATSARPRSASRPLPTRAAIGTAPPVTGSPARTLAV